MKRICYSIVLAFCLILVISACGDSSSQSDSAVEPQEETVIETQNDIEMLYSFIEQFNSVSSVPIIDVEECDITDVESGHYHTEFRLNAFKNALSLVGKYSEADVELIAYSSDYSDIRVYVSSISKEQAMDIIKYAFPILDSDLSSSEIDEAINTISKDGEVNGNYYGKLGLLYLRNELMIKRE